MSMQNDGAAERSAIARSDRIWKQYVDNYPFKSLYKVWAEVKKRYLMLKRKM